MTHLTNFSPDLVRLLPAMHALLLASNLVVHPMVERVTLEGSRGLGGHPRPNSDVDLSLVLRNGVLPAEEAARETLLHTVLATTLGSWRGPVECDLAARSKIATALPANLSCQPQGECHESWRG